MESKMHATLSEAGRYSYCAFVALSLQELFPEESEEKFKLESIRRFCRHHGREVKPVMIALATGEIHGDVKPYLKILRDELELKKDLSLLIKDLIVFAVQNGVYDARLRVCIHFAALRLAVPITVIDWSERLLVQCLSKEKVEASSAEDEKISKRARTRKIKKYLMIGLATVGGGAVLGLTGGLAAPLVTAGASAVIGGAGAAVLGSTAGIAIMSSVMGLAGAGLTGYKMRKRLGEIEEFAFIELSTGQELRVTLAISGWISNDNYSEAVLRPWRALNNSREQYVLSYESKYLLDLGTAIGYLYSFVLSMAAQEALKYTVLSGIIAAIAWPAALISAAGVIDNPWGVCQQRSAQVGRHLAEVLLQRQQGHRPVTLIGFSLGARVIYYCLKELATREACEGIIENAVLLGAPVPAHTADWASFRRVVAGNIINGYCASDWLLKFVYRTSSATMSIAGLQPIEWKDRRMCNLDLSHVISGHMDYYDKIDQILEVIGIGTKKLESCDKRPRPRPLQEPLRSRSEPNLLYPVRKNDFDRVSKFNLSGVGIVNNVRANVSSPWSVYSSVRSMDGDLGSSRRQTSPVLSSFAASQLLTASSGLGRDVTAGDLSELRHELEHIATPGRRQSF